MEAHTYISRILGLDGTAIEKLDAEMVKRTGKRGVIEKVTEENKETIRKTLEILNSQDLSAQHVKSVLRKVIFGHEKHLMEFLETVPGANEFDKAAVLAQKIVRVGNGFFLKRENAVKILKARPPKNLVEFLNEKSIDEVLEKHDITEVFSALRFIESNEWMHETFERAYSGFTANDFEEREIEVKVLGPEWQTIAEKFVAKKHHNVSHLKEFGVIFLNPIKEDMPGKFFRDFALLLHYFHEIEFYSKLFRKYSAQEGFATRLKALLRGDVPEIYKAEPGEWLIVQRYLVKENPNDPRLYLPRVNPESMHWARGEEDLTLFHPEEAKSDLRLWHDLDWVGGIFEDGESEVVSFDLEDNAMSLVSFMEGKEQFFNYHQREAMWTRIFEEYVGGEEKMEELLIENFDKGVIKF